SIATTWRYRLMRVTGPRLRYISRPPDPFLSRLFQLQGVLEMNKSSASLLGVLSGMAILGSLFSGPAAADSPAAAPPLSSRLPLELYEEVPIPGLLGRIDH